MSLIDLLVSGAMSLVHGIVALFPSYELPASISSLGSSLGNSVASANSVFPVVTLGIAIGVVVGVRLFLAAVDLAVWVYQLIPFKAT